MASSRYKNQNVKKGNIPCGITRITMYYSSLYFNTFRFKIRFILWLLFHHIEKILTTSVFVGYDIHFFI